MLNSFSRTELLLGHPAMEALKHARVAVFGIGGVGGYACEALVRSGVGAFDLIDDDKVCLYKADVMRDRMLDINPQADIRVHRCFFLPENAAEFPFSEYDYILDAVDTVSAKLSLAVQAQAAGVPIISAMGAGNKLDGSRFRISDISETRVCPLARVMRRELKKRGVRRLKVVWADEQPGSAHKCTDRRDIPGSTAFVPPIVGLLMAGEVIKDLTASVRQEGTWN